jgi:hypothetical protein
MKTIETTAELAEAVRFATTGKGDPDMLRKIAEQSSRIREELRRKHGTLDLAVPLIREIREE